MSVSTDGGTERERRQQFGRRVRVLRKERGLSQERLGARSGLHRTYVSSVERGQRNVSLDAIYALAKGLAVPAGELFDEQPTEPPEQVVLSPDGNAP